jgi:hypothetical protein
MHTTLLQLLAVKEIPKGITLAGLCLCIQFQAATAIREAILDSGSLGRSDRDGHGSSGTYQRRSFARILWPPTSRQATGFCRAQQELAPKDPLISAGHTISSTLGGVPAPWERVYDPGPQFAELALQSAEASSQACVELLDMATGGSG